MTPGPFVRGLILCLLALSCAARPAAAERRAFIVGNSAYVSTPALPNPANDARDLATRLKSSGYQVTLGIDLTRRQFLESFQTFGQSLRPDDLALVFYAGHGVQIGGENYLFPVDAILTSEADAKNRLVSLNALIADLGRVKTRIVILDACRNNPFADKLAEGQAARAVGEATRGLARVYAGVGSFIAYSTQPGNVAFDGQGRNSPFTSALIRHVGDGDPDVHAVMRRVRADVQRTTGEQQVPWENSSLVDETAFVDRAASGSGLPEPRATPPRPEPPAPQQPRAAQSFSYVTGLDPKGDNFLALRTAPGGGGRIATMGPNTLLSVLETRGEWRRVSLLDGTTGWAHGNWIACCRTFAVAGAPPHVPAPTPPAAPAQNCDALWRQRNAVWHRYGYCFTTPRGIQAFGNAGCSRNEAATRAAMTPADRALVDALRGQEQQLGCP